MIIKNQALSPAAEPLPKMVLFCKSFHEDVHRIRRLLESIQLFNKDRIPIYISIPAKELELFRSTISDFPCHLLTDEEILEKGIEVNGSPPENYPRLILQQIVKLEFWRMDYCQNYFWIDSDSYFIRPFCERDFFMTITTFTMYNMRMENCSILLGKMVMIK